MRFFRGILLATGVALALGGGQVGAKPAAKAKDPVVGQWVMNSTGGQAGPPMVLDFRPDGTVQFDTKAVEAQIRARAGKDPAARQQVEQALK
ncbi:MAG TPA: hypothetical protein VK689_00275, partial [Armatimonadota bacterium]|nr:hypothetical protein [Armatimonadota bacterium]